MGDAQIVDSMIHDGLWCAFERVSHGRQRRTRRREVRRRENEQDCYAAASHQKAALATREGWFADEIVPVTIPQKKGPAVVLDADETIRPDTTPESLAGLKPAFKKDGTVTAGNAPGVNDGAAAVVDHGGRAGARARPHSPGARRRPGHERAGAEARDDDSGRGRANRRRQDRMAPRGGRPLRAQRGVLGAGAWPSCASSASTRAA